MSKKRTKTLILYASKYGCTEDCAKYLGSKLNHPVETADLTNSTIADVQNYDWVVIGSPIYIGKIRKEVKLFCKRNLHQLLTKNVVLFLSCTTPEQAADFFKSNFPVELLAHARECTNFGGELRRQKMGFFDKKITDLVAKSEPKQIEVLYKNIDLLAALINAETDR